MSQINPYIENYQPKDYGGVDTSHCELDCSLGVNYWPLPESVMKRLDEIPAEEVKHYPHNEDLLQMILQQLLDRYRSIAPALTAENIHLGCGSFDLLCSLNLLYANPDKTIMGHAPQFTAYVDHVHCIGANYVAYPLDKDKNYAFDGEAFAAMVRQERPNLICCENPNNPTGQSISCGDILAIIAAAKETNAAIIFDEAYGDYLPLKNSAIQYVDLGAQNGIDIYVTRTFSKGYGMAGMRMGYVIGPAHGIRQLKKLVVPFNCNALARRLAQAMMAVRPEYLTNLGESAKKANEYLYEKIRAMQKFKIAKTSLYTPICTLYVEDETVDLCKALNDVGVATVSCQTYDHMGKNAVRMMLCENLERLVELLAKAKV